MADVMPLTSPPIPLSYRGVFDLEAIYKAVYDWMRSQELKYHETLYKSKPSQADLREMDIKVKGEVKLDEFHKWVVNVGYQLWDAKEVEVMQDGKKRKMMQGRVHITISGAIERDYQGVFEVSPFWLKARAFLLKITNWDEGFKSWDEYYYRLVKLQTIIKNILETPTAASAWG